MEFLEHLNISDETREEFKGADQLTPEQLKTAIEQHNAALFTQHKEALANDEDYVKPFHDKGHTKAMQENRARTLEKLKAAGYDGDTSDDAGEIPTTKIVERYLATLKEATKGKSKGNDELEGKLTERNKLYNELLKSIEEGTHPVISEAVQKATALEAKMSQEAGRNWLSSKLGKEYSLTKGETVLLISKRMEDAGIKYGPYGEEGEMAIVTLAGTKVRNEAGDKTLTTDEILSKFEAGLTKESNGQPPKPPTTVDPNDPNVMKVDPRIERRNAAADLVKAEADRQNYR